MGKNQWATRGFPQLSLTEPINRPFLEVLVSVLGLFRILAARAEMDLDAQVGAWWSHALGSRSQSQEDE